MNNVNSKTVCGYLSFGKQKHFAIANFSGQGRVCSGRVPNSCHCEINLLKIALNTLLRGESCGSRKWMRVVRKIKIVLFRFKIVDGELRLGEATPCKACASHLNKLGLNNVVATNHEGEMVKADLDYLAAHGIVTSGDRKSRKG
eukprot:GFUD01074725.1.p1 GENE.GFUD01074725.1~~GFUD01074725.1.p1  ORF type:complete len:144 (-),score=28.20 GFUD01074725.1:58-489(-)